MKYNKNILNEIANHIDVLNTIDGGVSMSFLNIEKDTDQFVVSVRTPGINKYSYHVELVNNTLLVYTILKLNRSESVVQVPSFMKYIPLPNYVDTDDISAVFEDGELRVTVPYNEQKNFKQRKIDIDYL